MSTVQSALGQLKVRLVAGELLSSVVVFLVALPLCLGIAIASGVPPAMGLLSGIVGGIVVGSLAGSPLQVSGPAAGLAVIVFDIVQNHGLTTLGIVVLAAGLIQIVAGLLRVGQWFRAVAPAVLYAMLSGIGILIAASQFHVMVDDAPASSGVTNLLTIPAAIYKGVLPVDGSPHHLAAAVGLLTIVILVVWNLVRNRLPAFLAVLPAPLLAVGAGTGVAAWFALPINYVTVPESLASMISFPTLEGLLSLTEPAVLGSAVALACVASAESLLSAAAVDRLHQGVRTDFDRELVAQGVGNTVLGVLGGLPVTGVIVRSSANVQAGAQTRWSAVMHGIWLLVCVAALPFVLQAIPISALAAVLVYIGYKLVNIKVVKQLWARGRIEVAIYAVTVICIVATNLLEGLIIGLGLSILALAWRSSKLDVKVDEWGDGRIDVDLHGAATFVSLPRLARKLEALDPTAEVHIHLEHLSYVDHACFELISEWELQREAAGGTLVLEWDELEHRGRGGSASGPAAAA
jgi:MFS superfamily sulfate permease-like transporter